ncbi:MAG: RdgB/HAM1 family non-canonical purine NTP pyrophosphatase [Candidatus Eisenbacteria bacterium]|nr:RdgB/HAM1 family non-canonical purine NTP pyrophosphatase [Candidatus Eisenbacteria bacterium]
MKSTKRVAASNDRLRIVLSSGNRDKLKEVTEILSAKWLEILSLSDFPGAPDPKEGKDSLKDNALLKARLASDFTGLPSIGDDTGLEVDILEGRPGVLSSRYAGENATYADNVKKLLDVLQSLPKEQRIARFKCVIALAIPGGTEKIFRGQCPGRIAFEPRGRNGFGYDPVFIPEGKKSSFAELSPVLKNRLSHRGRALGSLRRHLRKMYLEGIGCTPGRS